MKIEYIFSDKFGKSFQNKNNLNLNINKLYFFS